MKKRRFIHNALLLTAISLTMRGIGTWFMIYLSNRIGSEGVGLYQLASSIYILAVTLATSGITTAVTRVVSEEAALGNTKNANLAFKFCFFISLIFGSISAFLLFTNASFLGAVLLGDSRIILSLKYLAIGLPFLSTSSVIRGYFLGLSKPIKSVSSEIVEQITLIAVTMPILSICLPKGLEYACCGLVLGSTCSEILSCVYAIILYLCEKSPLNGVTSKTLLSRIFSIAAPIAFSSYIRSALVSLENILIPVGLKANGISKSDALSSYGMIKGMAMPILFFPAAILSAFSSLLVPEVSGANAINSKKHIDYIISKCFKVTIIFSILISGIFLCYSSELSILLYNSSKVGAMLQILAPLVPLMYLDQIVDSILKGLNQQLSSMKYNTADSVLRVALIYLLIPKIGIKGYIIMLYVGTIFNATLSINRLIVVSKVKFRLYRWLILPIISLLLSIIIVKTLLNSPLFISIGAITIIYVLLLRLFACITKNDIHWLKSIFIKNQ